MAALQTAHVATSRPLRAFQVSLRSPSGRFRYTALARSSGEALADGLASPALLPPVVGSAKPVGTEAEAMRLFRLKMALAGLVEG